MTHGTRAMYQKGCRQSCCRAANARYIAHLRLHRAKGHTPLGATVSGLETRRLINKLLIERFTKGQIARLLGLKRPILELHTDVITLRTQLRVRRIYRTYMTGEGPELPHV